MDKDTQRLMDRLEAQMLDLSDTWQELKQHIDSMVISNDKIELTVTIREKDLGRAIRCSQKESIGMASINREARSVTPKVQSAHEPFLVVTGKETPVIDSRPTPEEIAKDILAEGKMSINKPTKPVKAPVSVEVSKEVKKLTVLADDSEVKHCETPQVVENMAETVNVLDNETSDGGKPVRFLDKQAPVEYGEAGEAVDKDGDGRIDGVVRAPIRKGPKVQRYPEHEKHKPVGESGFGIVEEGEE